MQALITLPLSVACYLVFAGQVSTTEIVAGVPAACLVTAFAVVRHRGQDRWMRFRAPWGRLLLSAWAALLLDTGRVGLHLMRRLLVLRESPDGATDRQPFRPGSPDRADAGRRALVTLTTSFAPNGFVLDVAPSVLMDDQPTLLIHRLVAVPPDADSEWPI